MAYITEAFVTSGEGIETKEMLTTSYEETTRGIAETWLANGSRNNLEVKSNKQQKEQEPISYGGCSFG
jgi:hypothetical protein